MSMEISGIFQALTFLFGALLLTACLCELARRE